MNNNYSIEIAKIEFEKAIINELCKNNVIDFCQCNNIIKRLDEDIDKFGNKLKIKDDIANMIVKIPI